MEPAVEETASEQPAPAKRRFAPRNLWQTVGPIAVFVILFAAVGVLQPDFVGGGGIAILAVQATSILLVALGHAMVLHVGSIDLSNAAMAIFAAILLALLLGPLAGAAIVITLVVVTLVGAVNGWLVAYTQVPSFALTLGTLGILTAASLVISGATTVYAEANNELLAPLFGGGIIFLPVAFWLAVVLAVLLWVLLRRTSVGQAMTAVGLNESGAIFAGMRTRWVKVTAFALSGLLAGVRRNHDHRSGRRRVVVRSGQRPPAARHRRGDRRRDRDHGWGTNPLNVIFGALTITLIPIGAAAVGVPPQAQSLVYGLVIIIAVALTRSRARGEIVK